MISIGLFKMGFTESNLEYTRLPSHIIYTKNVGLA